MLRLQLWEWMALSGIAVLAAGVLLPAFQVCACTRATTASCVSNLKQMHQGFILYATDWDEKMPASNHWADLIDGHLRRSISLHDPVIHGADQYGYAFDSRLSSSRVADIKKPIDQLTFFGSISLNRNANDPFMSLPKPGRHYSRNNMGYLDGHVRKEKWR